MDIKKLQRAIVDGLEDVKGQDIVVFDTERLSPLFERVIIASGTSNRQTKALASSVRETVKSRGMQVMRTEGEDNGEWIIVDCGAAVVHLMQPAIRQYYHLEEIWGGKPVKMKVASGETRLVKASEPMDDEDDAPKAKKAAKKPAKAKSVDGEAVASASKKAPTRATGTKSAAAKPAKAAAAKPAAKKPATKATGTKSAAAKPATKSARKPAVKAAPVETVKVGSKKPATKKVSPKVAAAKPAVKKPAAKVAKPAARKTTVKTGTKSKAKA
ncbi:MAG: ribosome silencing factor [Mitsuaria chitosanitabida]|jgi:ribosome-associated protein|uniref:ribosome silencing factor n=1 Tax=Roseateles chitosanitabidus TaxID=65048 RepID=UPI001B1A2F1F|nr:ribosome silencing factor [Roseateles chitosanitabidus]MBO9688508.1 ribosome silencing factor [Roseateles chitosanitabidus]